MNWQNSPRLVIPISGIVIATLAWLMATLRSPDGLVSYEFVSSMFALALLGIVVGILWPQPVVVPPPLTEDQLAAILDRRYLRTEFSLPAHEHDLPDHNHTLDPTVPDNTQGVRELIDEPPPVIATPGRRPYRT